MNESVFIGRTTNFSLQKDKWETFRISNLSPYSFSLENIVMMLEIMLIKMGKFAITFILTLTDSLPALFQYFFYWIFKMFHSTLKKWKKKSWSMNFQPRFVFSSQKNWIDKFQIISTFFNRDWKTFNKAESWHFNFCILWTNEISILKWAWKYMCDPINSLAHISSS